MPRHNSTSFCNAFAAIALAVILAGCGNGDGRRVIRLNYSIFFPPTHVQTILAGEWASEIETATEGRVQIRIFPGGVLSKADQCYPGVIDGISDIGMSCFAYTRGRFPLIEGLDLPVGYRDGASATRIANEMISKYAPAELNDVHFLYAIAHGPGVIASREPVRSANDIRNMPIRATGLSAKIVDALGGNSVGMAQSDTYEALQKGVVKATFCPVETLDGWKQGEVVNHVTKTPAIGYTTVMFVVMNKERWEALPDDVKKIIDDISARWIPKHGQGWNDADDKGRKMLSELGREIYELDTAETEKWNEMVAPVLDRYTSAAEAKGCPGKAFLADLKRLVKEDRAR